MQSPHFLPVLLLLPAGRPAPPDVGEQVPLVLRVVGKGDPGRAGMCHPRRRRAAPQPVSILEGVVEQADNVGVVHLEGDHV